MGALDQSRALVGRVRANPGVAVAIAAGALLVVAWIGWAIYVTGENGARAGLGVLIACPVLLAALAVVALPFYGLYRLIRYLSTDSADSEAQPPQTKESPGEAEKAAG